MGSVTPGGAWVAQGHRQELIVLLLVTEWGWGPQWRRPVRGSQEEGKDRQSQPTGGQPPKAAGEGSSSVELSAGRAVRGTR